YAIIPLAPSGDEAVGGLAYYGVVTAVPGADQFTIPTLAGLGAGKFQPGATQYSAYVLRDAGGLAAVPQGETQLVITYDTATGNFLAGAFAAPGVGVGDEILLLHPSIAALVVGLNVPGVDSVANVLMRDVAGNKASTIPAMNLAPSATDDLVRHIKAILERVGATPADPDDSLLTNVGQRDDAATLDDLSDVTTTSIEAKLRRILTRQSPGTYTATVQGASRTAEDDMLDAMATYFVAAGAAMALQVNGNPARTNLQQALIDFFGAFGCDGANVFNPTVQGAARTDLDAALAAMATYFSAAGAAWSVQINGNAARTNLEQVWEDFSAVFGADGANVFNPTIQGAGQTNLDAALAQLAIYFAAAGAAMSIQVNGGAARANLELVLEDYFAVVGCDGANVFNPTVQGAARTTFEAAWDAMATYISPAGAAYSATVNPGAVAKTNIEETLEDLGDVLAGATGIVTYPAAAVPGNGVSMAEVLRQIYNDVVALVGAGILHEQADTPVTINAIAAGETNVLNLAVAATRYVVRSLRLKSADPGANTVTVRLYELVNDVLTVVDTFSMTTANFGTYQSLTDMFGLFQLAGDQLRVTVQASAGGPYAVTGQFSHALAT
ncbi:MAG: hypothetical protein Q8P31_09565, partial [Bacillota bacterium]|nr:hypothetical protein [Bacillota bacterium]